MVLNKKYRYSSFTAFLIFSFFISACGSKDGSKTVKRASKTSNTSPNTLDEEIDSDLPQASPRATVTPLQAGQDYFDKTINPMFNKRCNSCHGAPFMGMGKPGPLTIYTYSSMRLKLGDGTGASNSNLMLKVRNQIPHTGGDLCPSGLNQTPCLEIAQWWNLEFASGGGTGNAIVGVFSTVNDNGNALGWAAKSDEPTRVLPIRVYQIGAGGTRMLLGSTNASGPFSGSGLASSHGFNFSMPASSKNIGEIQISAFAFDSVANKEILLPGSPLKTALFAPRPDAVTYFNSTVQPLLGRCVGCHSAAEIQAHDAAYSLLRSPTPYNKGTSTTNQLYLKSSGGLNHGGGNQCGGSNLCQSLMQWWTLNFPN